jgi:hypothetical protein
MGRPIGEDKAIVADEYTSDGRSGDGVGWAVRHNNKGVSDLVEVGGGEDTKLACWVWILG